MKKYNQWINGLSQKTFLELNLYYTVSMTFLLVVFWVTSILTTKLALIGAGAVIVQILLMETYRKITHKKESPTPGTDEFIFSSVTLLYSLGLASEIGFMINMAIFILVYLASHPHFAYTYKVCRETSNRT